MKALMEDRCARKTAALGRPLRWEAKAMTHFLPSSIFHLPSFLILAFVLLTSIGCSSFQQTRHDVNDVFKAEKQVVQDIKKWAAELEKERATKLGVMNAVSNVFKMSAEYNQTIVMLTTPADRDNPEYKAAYNLVLYLKALGFGARDILLSLVGDTVSLIDAISLMVGG